MLITVNVGISLYYDSSDMFQNLAGRFHLTICPNQFWNKKIFSCYARYFYMTGNAWIKLLPSKLPKIITVLGISFYLMYNKLASFFPITLLLLHRVGVIIYASFKKKKMENLEIIFLPKESRLSPNMKSSSLSTIVALLPTSSLLNRDGILI